MMAEDQEIADLERQMEEAALNGTVEEAEPEAPISPEPTPEVPVIEPVDTVPEAQPEQQPEVPAEPEAVTDADILKAELEETRARMRHFESLVGRHAGAQGFIEKLKSERDAAVRSLENARRGGEVDDVPPPEPVRPQADPLVQWAKQRAVNDAISAFGSQHQDFQEVFPKIVEYMQRPGIVLNGSDDPNEVQNEATRALNEAYSHVQAERSAARVAELRVKQAETTKKAAQAKLKAGVSGSGGAAAPTPKQKSVDEMSIDEVDAELRRVTQGQRW